MIDQRYTHKSHIEVCFQYSETEVPDAFLKAAHSIGKVSHIGGRPDQDSLIIYYDQFLKQKDVDQLEQNLKDAGYVVGTNLFQSPFFQRGICSFVQ